MTTLDAFLFGLAVGALPSLWIANKWQRDNFKRRVAESDLMFARFAIKLLTKK